MPRFRVAHVREQGIDLIIVPLASDFGQKGSSEQQEVIAELQIRAQSAGYRRACMEFQRPVKFHCAKQLASVLPEPYPGCNRGQH